MYKDLLPDLEEHYVVKKFPVSACQYYIQDTKMRAYYVAEHVHLLWHVLSLLIKV
jgi:hypothetical protein